MPGTRYAGRKGRVYLAADGSSEAAPVATLNHWTIDMTTDTIDVSAFGDSNKQYVQGLFDVKGTLSGFWNDADSALFSARSSASAVKMYLYPSLDAVTKYAYGTVWLSITMDTAVADAVKVDGTWVAGGDWGFLL